MRLGIAVESIPGGSLGFYDAYSNVSFLENRKDGLVSLCYVDFSKSERRLWFLIHSRDANPS